MVPGRVFFMPQSLHLLPDNSSVLRHNVPDLPIAIQQTCLSDYANLDIIPHWNDDITLIRIDRGQMNVTVENSPLVMQAGDLILINAKQKHHLYSICGNDCAFTAVLFHPNIFLANLKISSLPEDYDQFGFPSFQIFPADSEDNSYISLMVGSISSLNDNRPPMFQLQILGYLHLITARCLSRAPITDPFLQQPHAKDQQILHRMLDYVHHHLQDRITITEIAAAGGVCQSRCFEIFRECLQCSPVEYINTQRLAISCSYLVDRAVTIASVATICGFSSQSYYTKLFLKKYGITPSRFREQNLQRMDPQNA